MFELDQFETEVESLMTVDLKELTRRIKTSEVIDICMQLLKIPSPPCEEGEIATKIADLMQSFGLSNVRVDGLSNVYGIFDSGTPGETLMLMSHTDASPSGTIMPNVEDGKRFDKSGEVVTGDGAVAPKGQLSAMLVAAKALIEAEAIERGKIIVAGCVRDTTANHDGVRFLLKENRLISNIAIVGEPTDNKVLLGCRGRFEIEVTCSGQPAHAGSPDKAANPLFSIAQLLIEMRRLKLPQHDGVGPATLTPIDMRCEGARPNTPQSATVVFDRRATPGESEADVQEPINGICSTLSKQDQRLTFDVRCEKAMLPYIINEHDEIVQRLRKPYAAVRNCNLEFVYSRSFSTDTAFLQNQRISSLAFGPGRIEDFASDHVEVRKLVEGALLYSAVTASLLNEGVHDDA